MPGTWSADKGVVWATPLPGPSHATPAVFADRVFVTSIDKKTGDLLALGVQFLALLLLALPADLQLETLLA